MVIGNWQELIYTLVSVFSRLFTAVKGLVKQAKVDNQNPWVQKTLQHPECVIYINVWYIVCKILLSSNWKNLV